MTDEMKHLAITVESDMLLDINAVLVEREGITLHDLAETEPQRVYWAMRAAQLLFASRVDESEQGDAVRSLEASMPLPLTEPIEVTVSVWASPRVPGRERLPNELAKTEMLSFVVEPPRTS